MRYHRSDVVRRAITVLDEYGLESLTMRRLAAELGVQPSALYHHVPNKQTLLAAVADEILGRGRRPRRARQWDRRVVEVCRELRDAMLAYRDGAEVVVTAYTFGLGAGEPATQLREALRDGGLPDDLVDVGTRALLHLVFGHTVEEQTALQAASAGAIDRAPGGPADFERGLELVLDGLRSRVNR
ncbi:TetR family transcriptional regulator [Saccharopolyspora erythraea NRRL 2338]|uniref:Transcriptional regulator, TetR family n=2 Tax=Saccharopolyspora erythraea TaxID=1836 RepID=A4FIS5_SACEN|nr:TetR/AcrR family transcriptional regulator C-terminal domain-containing protein [Saccharopolyspora erythraea]EQD81797.1 TetR family transcriptional regulator [Saccharopolyspora erythraea D]PFG97624.1 TetR family transcriptional regulator [Saccharopolyspora erythraea NRRL 2338]QRK87782.1 TetR/AcrR family transcriptional regulator C-terminal domain-containing protein [Saccharopolyspora erythraea]CAM03950.1 transcriptional regulator, TetR family [Saccharopolyspora erythraea NRRL 2338]